VEFALIERIAGIMVPVLATIIVGWLYARRHSPDMAVVNRISMDVFAPTLIFSALASRDFSIFDNRWLLVASALIVLGSGALAWGVAKIAGVQARTFVPPMMFNNAGNMGLPIAVLAYGAPGLAPAVAMFVVSNAIHFTLGARIVDPRASIRHLLLTPMNLATAAGFAFAATDLPRPALVMGTLELMAGALIPLMLFSLGVRMVSVNRASWRIGLLGAVICPLTGFAVAVPVDLLLPLTDAQRGMVYIFASLPPAVLNFMVAERYGREPGKVAAMVLVGNIASVFFVPLGLALGLR
jgi:malate permease and related proteins